MFLLMWREREREIKGGSPNLAVTLAIFSVFEFGGVAPYLGGFFLFFYRGWGCAGDDVVAGENKGWVEDVWGGEGLTVEGFDVWCELCVAVGLLGGGFGVSNS